MIKRISYEELHERRNALATTCRAGTLTEEMLDREIDCIVEDPGDGPPETIGFDWVKRNPSDFARVVKDVSAFLRRHFDNRYFTALVVLYPELLGLLPEPERAGYVRATIMRHGAWNTGWIPAALAVRIARETLAEIVLAKLGAVSEEQMKYSNFLHDFLEYGFGDTGISRPGLEPVWGVLSDFQLVEALEICARKAPANVLRAHHKISHRLGSGILIEIVSEAVRCLDYVVESELIASLPLDERLAFAARLAPVTSLRGDCDATMRFVMQLMHDLDESAARQLFAGFGPVFENAPMASTYRAAHAAAKKLALDPDRPHQLGAIAAVFRWCREQLSKQGYQLGTIEEGQRFDRRTGRTSRQLQARDGRRIYVQARYQHRYFPRVGDRVLYRPSQGDPLTSLVTAVTFIPVDPSKEY